MRIFVDVGAHYGETVETALDPKWGFDRIYTLEPSSWCLKILRGFRDGRLLVEPVALSDHNGSATLHGTGLLGGSLYSDKKQLTDKLKKETVTVVKASEWFDGLPDAELFVKMNCEGAEADILEDLLDTGSIGRISFLYVDFDIRKIPSQAHRQDMIERRLRGAGVDYVSAEHFGLGPERWLDQCCSKVRPGFADRLRYRLRLHVPPYDRMVTFLRRILPPKVHLWLARRFGRRARA